eukprot:2636422-Rhodomonas_salina.2
MYMPVSVESKEAEVQEQGLEGMCEEARRGSWGVKEERKWSTRTRARKRQRRRGGKRKKRRNRKRNRKRPRALVEEEQQEEQLVRRNIERERKGVRGGGPDFIGGGALPLA